MIVSPVVSRSLIGRDAQRALFAERWAAARDGRGSIILVSGDAGIGKTRLVEAMIAGAGEGTVVAAGACLEYLQAPFAPFAYIVRESNAALPSVLDEKPSLRRTLASIAPEVATDAATDDVGASALRQSDALVQYLVEVAARRPLVVVIEDLHWADTASLEVLGMLAGAVERAALIVVATYRPDDVAPESPAAQWLARAARGRATWQLPLQPLADADLRRLVREASGASALRADIVDAICRRSEGNPLFAEELLKSALERPGRDGAPELPVSVEQSVRARVAHLSDVQRRTLVVAAAIGKRFSGDLLAAVLHSPVDDVRAALRRARDLHLVVETGVDAYAFRHALVHDAVYAGMLAAEARPIHAAVASAMEQTGAAAAADVAGQWSAAGEAGKAAPYDERAGDQALALYAPASAAQFYERALSATDLAPAHRAALLRKAAGAYHDAGNAPRARAAYGEAMAALRAAGDAASADAVLVELARLEFNDGNVPVARRLAAEALEHAADPASPARYSAQVYLAGLAAFEDDAATARRCLDAAAAFTGTPPARDEIRFHQFRAMLHARDGDADAAIADCERAAELARAAGEIESAVNGWGNLAVALARIGERERALEAFENARGTIAAHGLRSFFAGFCLVQYALACLRFGRLEQARELLSSALDLGIDAKKFDILAARLGVALGVQLGDEDLLGRAARQTFEDLTTGVSETMLPYVAAAFVQWHEGRGERDEAVRLLRLALEALAHMPGQQTEHWLFAQVAELGDDAMRAQARPYLAAIAAASDARLDDADAYLHLFDALAARHAGDDAAAREHGDKAAALFEQLGWPWHRARALEAARRTNDALLIYKEIGAAGDVRRVEAIPRRGRPRGTSAGMLSAREQEVVSLIARGLSNKAIAAQLSLSERTVESHASSALGKLGLSTRAELIAHFARTAT